MQEIQLPLAPATFGFAGRRSATKPYQPGLNSSILMPFSASAIFILFYFHLFTSAKHFPLRIFFILGNKKKLLGERLGEKGGAQGAAIVGQTLWNTQHGVGRCARKSPITKWANMLSLQKKFTEAKHSLSQQRQLVH